MITLNNKKFARNDKEFTDSLFSKGGTCTGYYKVNRKSVAIMDMQGEKVGVIANNVLAKASKQDNGKYWYSYGDVDIIGTFESYSSQYDDVKSVMQLITK